ncbi:Molybdenum cofactor synthesis domain protein [[Clostridium] ultunense Esp]|nr:Molybdenum cofactor synthesis domain protein [[Clostridium] ultunense Esp]
MKIGGFRSTMWRVGILSCSDRGSRGEREDKSKDLIAKIVAEAFKGKVTTYHCVPDEIEVIKETLFEMIDHEGVDVIITTGGTGLSPRDVTPEATLQVVDRIIPGFAEEMRRKASAVTRKALFTRAVVGTRKTTLIINLPGSPDAAELCLNAIIDQIEPALLLLQGKKGV